MLRRLAVRDFAIVTALEIEWADGFTVLTGETGAGKSILIDALQLALGQRADASVVREGAARADITAEFDAPGSLSTWLQACGFETDAADAQDGATLLLRRSVDAGGKSRGWINGHAATMAQLREVAEHVLDIHGQHAWQGLMRPASVRQLLDDVCGADPDSVKAAWQAWRDAQHDLERARHQADALAREREGLAWQVSELKRLAPREGEWQSLDAEHRRLAHGQALIEGTRTALEALEGEDRRAPGACASVSLALDRLQDAQRHDDRLQSVIGSLTEAQALLSDAAHELRSYLDHAEPDPARLQELEERLSAWMGLARRLRRQPAELPELLTRWEAELAQIEQSADVETLQQRLDAASQLFEEQALALSRRREQAAPRLAAAVTQAMQQLGMGGGRFEIALLPETQPQSWGRESVEFRVAGHAGSTPRALAKVASGGELSRLALAIAVTTAKDDRQGAATLIFDEIDAGVGGTVADTVGRLMKQLGLQRQVLAVTHLAQVASCADHHLVVSKRSVAGRTESVVQPVEGEARVAELARMLGGERLSTSLAHAQSLLDSARS